jgi:hypothetical protein
MNYTTIRVDQQVYDLIRQRQKRSDARTLNDALRLMLGMPMSEQRARVHTIAAVKAALGDHPDSTASQIARAVDRAYSTTTSILAGLEKAGQVQRRPAQTRRRGAIAYLWRLKAPSADANSLRKARVRY